MNEMPEQPKTKEIPAVTDRALLEDLTRSVKEGFTELRADIQLVSTDVSIVKDRVRVVEERVRTIEDDRRNDSMPAKVVRVTDNDAKQDAAIALIVTKVDKLEVTQQKQLAILTRLDEVAANPMVRRVAYAVGAALLAYLTARGLLPK